MLGAHLPEVEWGDVIAFLETGAYQESSASNFNALPRPATVLVHGGDAEVIKAARRSTTSTAATPSPTACAAPEKEARS